MILTISSILIILAIILLPVSGILNQKIHHLIFEDYLNPNFEYHSFLGFIKRRFLNQNKKELLNDYILLNKIKIYNILLLIVYCALIFGLGMFIFNIMQNQNH